MKLKFTNILLLWVSITFSMYAQGTLKTYPDFSSAGLKIYADRTADDGFVMAGNIGAFDQDLLVKKIDILGNVQWSKQHIRQTSQQAIDIKFNRLDSCYYVLYQENNFNGRLLKLNANGLTLYDKSLSINGMKIASGTTNASLEITSDNHLLVHAFSIDSLNVYTMGLSKLDTAANTLWSRFYPYPSSSTHSIDVKECSDNNYIMLGYRDTLISGNALMTYVVKVDTAGNKLWENNYYLSSFTWPNSIKELRNGNFLILGSNPTGNNQRMFSMLLNPTGTKLWHVNRSGLTSQYNRAFEAVENADSSFTICGQQYNTTPSFSHNLAFLKMDQSGNELYFNGISTGQAVPNGNYIWHAPNNGYFIIGVDGRSPFLLTTDSLGNLFTNYVYGRVFRDLNSNCLFDNGEPAMNGCILNISSNNSTYNSTISNNADGSFLMQADSGSFTVTASQLSPYWQFCNNPQTVSFTGFFGRDTIDFPLTVLDSCSFLEVDISSTIIRRCFPASYYVNYRNRVTVAAPNAYVDVTLDPYIDYVSSSVPFSSQNGNTYRFQVGNLNVNSAGFFTINVQVQCDTTVTLGQVHCTEAHIYPDSLCINSLWNAAIMEVDARCENDTAVFTILNDGFANSSQLNYKVIEDLNIVQISNYQLNVGQQMEIRVPVTAGKYYSLMAEQENGFPSLLGDPNARTRFIYCGQTGPMLPSLPNQFYNGNSRSSVSIDCQSNRGAYDPNDKNAQPLGYGPSHLIENNIPLNYHIRFQNTGTDTAFNVFIIDTLSPFLNPATLRMGASSHNYRWELRSGNVLVVYFDNIMLPDSNVNEPASNGFFKMEIEMQPNLNVGTVITNSAGIYFDFNAPVITNETFHTIGTDFINIQISSVDLFNDKPLEISVYPNPADEFVIFETDLDKTENLSLEIMDVNGRILNVQDFNYNKSVVFNRNDLPSGVYFFRVLRDKVSVKSGKIIMK